MKSQKSLERFFSRNDTAYIIGTSLLVVAFFALLIGRLYSYWIGFICAPIGLVMFFAGSIGRVGQEDIDKAVADLLWEFDKPLLEDVRLARRVAKHPGSVRISQYDYEGDRLLSKRGKDGAWRTSIHTAVTMMFLQDGIIFIKKTVFPLADNMTSDKSIKETAEYKFSDIAYAEIIRDSVRLKDIKHEYEVRRARLKIVGTDGRALLTVQLNDDLESDKLAENINKEVKLGHA